MRHCVALMLSGHAVCASATTPMRPVTAMTTHATTGTLVERPFESVTWRHSAVVLLAWSMLRRITTTSMSSAVKMMPGTFELMSVGSEYSPEPANEYVGSGQSMRSPTVQRSSENSTMSSPNAYRCRLTVDERLFGIAFAPNENETELLFWKYATSKALTRTACGFLQYATESVKIWRLSRMLLPTGSRHAPSAASAASAASATQRTRMGTR